MPITIAATVRSPNIAALARARGWNGYGQIICTINPGVDVATLSISGIPHDCLTLLNHGGRIGGVLNGGTAIYTRTRIRIDNTGGTIFGGGGFGGGGGSYLIQNPNSSSYRASGNGGSGGNGAGFSSSGVVTMSNAQSGSSGSSQQLSGPSTGSLGTSYGGRGGYGGSIGQAGTIGFDGSASGNYTLIQVYQPSQGQPAGLYVDGASLVTWIVEGTRLGNAAN
ncbi:hypothetical protein [Comamonas squillarum]|uniref:Uncharacterized protein n=1 Tax=Comamonas squillarum TaxID=2977320 RepID=A0ABY6A1M0_9BURK|nr:hypothetical protein [Comamonas sp. PR12]UXC20152.1 hypothetical protein N4T19_08605 [Comamonas sp. PR12]